MELIYFIVVNMILSRVPRTVTIKEIQPDLNIAKFNMPKETKEKRRIPIIIFHENLKFDIARAKA